MAHLFHVTSVLNRESILAHGLDWTRMGAAPGIAGSSLPEEDGVFLCRDEFEAGFFVQMNNTGGPVEVWAVAGIGEEQLITSGSGFCYFPARIPRSQVTLADWPAQEPAPAARRPPQAAEEQAAQEEAAGGHVNPPPAGERTALPPQQAARPDGPSALTARQGSDGV
jgi:hypothetical protein